MARHRRYSKRPTGRRCFQGSASKTRQRKIDLQHKRAGEHDDPVHRRNKTYLGCKRFRGGPVTTTSVGRKEQDFQWTIVLLFCEMTLNEITDRIQFGKKRSRCSYLFCVPNTDFVHAFILLCGLTSGCSTPSRYWRAKCMLMCDCCEGFSSC